MVFFVLSYAVWMVLNYTYAHVLKAFDPDWLFALGSPPLAVLLCLTFNLSDWWTTELCLSVSSKGPDNELNPIARAMMKLGPAYNHIFKLGVGSLLLIWLTFNVNAAENLSIMTILFLASANNAIRYYLRAKELNRNKTNPAPVSVS